MKFRTISFSSESEFYEESLRIRKSVFIDEQKIDPLLEIDEHEKECVFFLTYADGVPASTGRLRVAGGKIKFERIATLRSFRGKGSGSALMEEMLGYARAKFSSLTPFMHAQLDAAGFYEKIGWRRMGEIFTEADIPHVAMTPSDLKTRR